ncbi:MAG: hypothetical protein ABNH15_02265 [Alcanivorax sp.]|jgi:dynactin complex subunit|nr:MAG: hypothetical protein COA68_01185 [Oceanobacter sp.]
MRLVMAMLALSLSTFSYAELTEKQVSRWVESMPSVQTWIEKNSDKVNKHDLMKTDNGGMAGMFDGALKELKRVGLDEDFSNLIKTQGYDSEQQWAEDSSEIVLTFMAITMEKQSLNRQAIEQQLAQVKNSPLPEAQKKMMANMLQSSLSMMDEVEAVPVEDKTLVRPYMSKIEGQFGGHKH